MSFTEKNRQLPKMWEEGKTILMKKEHAKAWLKNLRSGKFKQGREQLGSAKTGYCCLGLLEKTVSGKVESGATSYYSSQTWLRLKGVRYRTAFNADDLDPQICNYANQGRTQASVANDDFGLSFKEIADLIEPCIQTY